MDVQKIGACCAERSLPEIDWIVRSRRKVEIDGSLEVGEERGLQALLRMHSVDRTSINAVLRASTDPTGDDSCRLKRRAVRLCLARG